MRADGPNDGTSRRRTAEAVSGAMVTDGTAARQGSLLHLDMRPRHAVNAHAPRNVQAWICDKRISASDLIRWP